MAAQAILPRGRRFNWSEDHTANRQVQNLQARIDQLQRDQSFAQWNNIPTQCVIYLLNKLSRARLKSLPKTLVVFSGSPPTQTLKDGVFHILDQANGQVAKSANPAWVHPFGLAWSPDYSRDLARRLLISVVCLGLLFTEAAPEPIS
jgi:hypothetical protein